MAITRWEPFQELESMERRMRRFFDEVRLVPGFLPAADVYETDEEYVVELEVPGFEQPQLTIEQSDHTLTIRGDRAEATEKTERAFHLHERLARSFERRFQLPREVDTKRVEGTFHEGVLTVHAPKAPAAKPRRIPIGK
ncbi:MAG: Hsp20/alpha crystallin family protein [Gaiellaceae bacterium]